MEKEIPFPQEKRSKSERLRETARILQSFALDRRPTEVQWQQATDDLTQDDLDHLQRMAQGHQERAIEAGRRQEIPEVFEEAAAAILLWPRDGAWAAETASLLRPLGLKGPQASQFFAQVAKRTAKGVRIPKWVWPVLLLVATVGAGLGGLLAVANAVNPGQGSSVPSGPRNLEASFDTRGVKANIQVVRSRLVLFPEATVAELSAWVIFPNHRVDLWEGTVAVLDAKGQELTHRVVVFRASRQGPLEVGQGLEVFEQFDAWPWFDRAVSFQLVTTRILAQEAHPSDREDWPFVGSETLASGYNLKVWRWKSEWTDRFASRVNTLTLELENTGLKPFAELQFALTWRNDQGQLLKTIRFRPVSPFRTVLPSGGRLGWTQESIFNTEVFPWAPGAEPRPALELVRWQ